MVSHSPEAGPDPCALQSERMLAIVLGASEWPFYADFPAAPSFRRSAYEIADYLIDRNALGLSPRNVKVLFDSFDDAPEISAADARFHP